MKSKKLISSLLFLAVLVLPISRAYSAQTEANGADLKPTDLTWTPQEIHPDDEITFVVSYMNQGTAAISPDGGTTITYQLTLQKTGDSAETVGEPVTGNLENLALNASAQVSGTLTAPAAGEYQVTVELDNGNQLQNEVDETNNTITKTLSIQDKVEPAVELMVEVDDSNKISVATTSSQFCEELLIQETNGAPSNSITVEALSLVDPDNRTVDETKPTLSLDGCNGSEHEVTVPPLAEYGDDIIYLASNMGHVGTFRGTILLRHGDAAAVLYQLEVVRSSRQLTVSPTPNGTLTLSTMKTQLRQPLRLDQTAGQAVIADLTYGIWLRKKGTTAIANVWLEQDETKWVAGEPLPIEADFPLHIDIVGVLSQTVAYEGELTFYFGGDSKEIPLAITRTPLSLEIWPVSDNKLTFNQTGGDFEKKLAFTSPLSADQVTVTYEALLTPNKVVSGEPTIALWTDADPKALVDEAGFALEPGESKDFYLIGALPESAVYTGELLLHFSDNSPSQRIELAFTYSKLEDSGLTLSTPDQLQATTNWWIGRGIDETITFQLKEENNQSVTLLAPKPTKLTLKDAENDTVITDSLSDTDVWSIEFDQDTLTEGNVLPPNERVDVMLTLDGLHKPGKYEAEIEVKTADGRNFTSTAVVFVRHHWLIAAIVAFISVLVAWGLQYYVKDGRARLEAKAKLIDLHNEIKIEQDKDDQWPDWVKFKGQTPSDVWRELLSLLENKEQYAGVASGAADLQAVEGDIDTRYDFLKVILEKISDINKAYGKLSQTAQSKWCQPSESLQEKLQPTLNSLYSNLLDGDKTKTELEDQAKEVQAAIKELNSMEKNLWQQPYRDSRKQLIIKLDAVKAAKVKEEKLGSAFETALEQEKYKKTGELLKQAHQAYVQIRWQQLTNLVKALKSRLKQLPNDFNKTYQEQLKEAEKAIEGAILTPTEPPNDNTPPQENEEKWKTKRRLYWKAWSKVWQLNLVLRPDDIEEAIWKSQDGYKAMDGKLGQFDDLPNDTSPNEYMKDVQEALAQLHVDLTVCRLEKLAGDSLPQNDKIPPEDRKKWEQQKSGFEIKQHLFKLHKRSATFEKIDDKRKDVLPKLQERLSLLSQIVTKELFDKPSKNWAKDVTLFIKKNDEFNLSWKAHEEATEEYKKLLLNQAEHGYAAAYLAYKTVLNTWPGLQPAPAEPVAAFSEKTVDFGIVDWGYDTVWEDDVWGDDVWDDYAQDDSDDSASLYAATIIPSPPEKDSPPQKDKTPPSLSEWEKLKAGLAEWRDDPLARIRRLNIVVVIVALIIAVITGLTTNAFGKTFGSIQDYITLIFLGFTADSIMGAILTKYKLK
ncbi:MAG: hypothetical protein GY803_30230 [Chloroflexi bacterium]|nr:hypothetical protein [Chloroflexota bacterium]